MFDKNACGACLVALLAAGIAGCGQGKPPADRPLQQAQELTRENFRDFGDHVVHFNAQLTTMLPPEVARAFGIARSGSRAMLNIVVLRKLPEGGSEAVSAAVTVSAVNLTGQLKDVRIRELIEGDAIYYIGEVTVSNQEWLTFTVRARPEGAETAHEIRFRQQFYTD
jgi:hypothetical protein